MADADRKGPYVRLAGNGEIPSLEDELKDPEESMTETRKKATVERLERAQEQNKETFKLMKTVSRLRRMDLANKEEDLLEEHPELDMKGPKLKYTLRYMHTGYTGD